MWGFIGGFFNFFFWRGYMGLTDTLRACGMQELSCKSIAGACVSCCGGCCGQTGPCGGCGDHRPYRRQELTEGLWSGLGGWRAHDHAVYYIVHPWPFHGHLISPYTRGICHPRRLCPENYPNSRAEIQCWDMILNRCCSWFNMLANARRC